MARRRQCAKCGTYNAYTATECESCAVQFSDLKRESVAKSGPVTCSHPGCGAVATMCVGGAWTCGPHFTAKMDIPSRDGPGYQAWKQAMAKHMQRIRV